VDEAKVVQELKWKLTRELELLFAELLAAKRRMSLSPPLLLLLLSSLGLLIVAQRSMKKLWEL